MPFKRAIQNQRARLRNRRLHGADAGVEAENIVSVWSNAKLFDFEISQMEQTLDVGIVRNSNVLSSDNPIKRLDNPFIPLHDDTVPINRFKTRLKLNADWRG